MRFSRAPMPMVPRFLGGGLSRGRSQRSYGASLGDRILAATSDDHVRALLQVGNGYRGASNGTKTRWLKLAERRRRELAEAQEVTA